MFLIKFSSLPSTFSAELRNPTPGRNRDDASQKKKKRTLALEVTLSGNLALACKPYRRLDTGPDDKKPQIN